jgi:hypothetical protein
VNGKELKNEYPVYSLLNDDGYLFVLFGVGDDGGKLQQLKILNFPG